MANRPFLSKSNEQNILVEEKSVVKSLPLRIHNKDKCSIAYKASSGGIPHVVLEIEQSHDGILWNIPIDIKNEIIIDSSDYQIRKLNKIISPFIRCSIKGGFLNGGSTRINAWICEEEFA